MKKTAIFIANGLEECEALNTADLLKRAGIRVDLVSVEDTKDIVSSHNLHFMTDMMIDDINIYEYDALILPGGLKGTQTLSVNDKVLSYLKQFHKEGRLIAAICAAPSIFVKEGYVRDNYFSVYPGFECGLKTSGLKVSVDNNVITAKGLGASFEFAHAIISYLLDKEAADNVLKEIQY